MTPAPTPLPTDALPALWRHVAGARWFAGKGRSGWLAGAALLSAIDPDAPAPVHHGLARVCYDDGSTELYQLLLCRHTEGDGPEPICPAPGGGLLCDAAEDPPALRDWARVLLAGAGAGPGWSVEEFAVRPGPVHRAVRLTGEQSNTSIEIDDDVIIKVFRRLEPGDSLDITTHAALNRAGVGQVARLHCALRADLGAGRSYDLAMAGQRFADAADGWRLACDAAAAGRPIGPLMRGLGHTLAQVHQALAECFGVTELNGDRVAARMTADLEAGAADVEALGPRSPALRRIFDGLRGRHLPAQRVHGDFHLGQALDTPAGWRIIDFEGEPLRSAAERRLPDSPWRDVAGMMRSLSYAAATSGLSAPQARSWENDARAGFLAGYGHGDDALPLRAYEASKAVYETVYETLNRPDWAQIPLGAITAMCSRAAQPPEGSA